MTDGGPWSAGSLNNASIQASPKSLLTASVDYATTGESSKGELKLYYNRDNDSMMWCTWVSLGQQAWSQKKINDKY